MAKAQDPNPEFNSMPEMVVDSVDYNLFYKPDRVEVSSGLVQLSKSLQSLVPALTNFAITEEIKGKEKDEARAIEDFKINKMSFAKMVKSGKIPEGANPHYFNKMMELDLSNKARKFKLEFDTYASENSLEQSLTGDAWNEVYESKLKEYYEREGLDKFDPLALSKAFFNSTSTFRNEREQQHNASRMAFIKKNTENNAIKNYSGLFIEAQADDLSTEDLFKKIGFETKSFMDLGTSGTRANDLFLSGFKKYLDVIQDQEGFDYARTVLNDFENLKLGTGYFAGEKGSRRNNTIRLELIAELNDKELSFLEGTNKRKLVRDDRRKQILGDEFFVSFNEDDFDMSTFLDQKVEDDNGDLQFKYSNKDKFYIRGLNEALNKSVQITSSDASALRELIDLEENNPYLVKQKAIELSRDGKLSNSDFKHYYNSIGLTSIYKKNQFFLLSTPFQEYMTVFKDSNLATIPGFGLEMALLRAKFTQDMVDWHRENANDEEYRDRPYKYQKAFDAEVKAIMGDIFTDSMFIQSAYDSIGKEFSQKYGIVIRRKEQ